MVDRRQGSETDENSALLHARRLLLPSCGLYRRVGDRAGDADAFDIFIVCEDATSRQASRASTPPCGENRI